MTLEELFKQEIRTARRKLGYTHEQMAEALSISLRWYQGIEQKGTIPGKLILLRLEVFLHWSPEALRPQLGLIEPKPSPRALAKLRRSADDAQEPDPALPKTV